jgi:thiamine biosynthesis protein ThiC
MLTSSSGIGYAQHFCSGMEMMAKITLGEKHLSCGMEEDASASDCGNETAAAEAHDCCKNHITKIHTDDNFAKASFDLKFSKSFVATFVSVFILQEVEIASIEKTFFADYSPPPLEQNLNILYETFLI